MVTADGTALKIGTILGIFPLEELAPIKFEHRPKFWLRIAPQEPEVGEIIALVPIDIKDLMNAEVPPILGQVMAKRTESTANLRLCPFKRVLSLGLAGPLEQSAMTLPGSFAINRHGTLVAVYAGIQMIRNQALRFVAPVADLREQIDKLADFQPEAKEPKARQAFQFVARATLLLVDRDIEGTVRELEAAVKLSPPDYPGNREKTGEDAPPSHATRRRRTALQGSLCGRPRVARANRGIQGRVDRAQEIRRIRGLSGEGQIGARDLLADAGRIAFVQLGLHHAGTARTMYWVR